MVWELINERAWDLVCVSSHHVRIKQYMLFMVWKWNLTVYFLKRYLILLNFNLHF